MEISRDGSQNWESPKGWSNSVLNWKVKGLQMWRNLSCIPKEDLLIGGIFATVIIITIWLAARLL
jgi:hypothetical protein